MEQPSATISVSVLGLTYPMTGASSRWCKTVRKDPNYELRDDVYQEDRTPEFSGAHWVTLHWGALAT